VSDEDDVKVIRSAVIVYVSVLRTAADNPQPSAKKPRPSKSKAAPPARPQRASKTKKNLAESNSEDSD
jgi:hypothetical protein